MWRDAYNITLINTVIGNNRFSSGANRYCYDPSDICLIASSTVSYVLANLVIPTMLKIFIKWSDRPVMPVICLFLLVSDRIWNIQSPQHMNEIHFLRLGDTGNHAGIADQLDVVVAEFNRYQNSFVPLHASPPCLLSLVFTGNRHFFGLAKQARGDGDAAALLAHIPVIVESTLASPF